MARSPVEQTPDGSPESITSSIHVEDAGPSRKLLTIEVAAETVDRHLELSFDTLAAEAALPGFRKGRAPRRLIEKKFGQSVRGEAKGQLLAQAYSEAVEKHQLKVLAEPRREDIEAPELESGKALKIKIAVDVLPTFETPGTDGIAIRKPIVDVSDALVSEELERLCTNEGELEPREAPEPGDYLTGHGVMIGRVTEGGVEKDHTFHDIQGCVVRVPRASDNGRGMILGVVVDDLGPQLGLPGAGQSVTIRATGPANHEIELLRNARLTITFAVTRADRIIPADATTLAQRAGLPDEASLRDALKRQLDNRARVQQQAVMRQQVARHLLEHTTLELPERLSADQAERVFQRRRLELSYRGVPDYEIERHIADLRTSAAEAAKRELKLFFILTALAEKLDIRVDEAEVNGRIAQIAFQQRRRPDELRQHLIQTRQVNGIVNQIRDHKVLDAILQKAAVAEMPAAEFNELMSQMARGEATE